MRYDQRHAELRPEQRFIYWREMRDSTPLHAQWRTFTPGCRHARLIIPVPLWTARVVWMLTWYRRRFAVLLRTWARLGLL